MCDDLDENIIGNEFVDFFQYINGEHEFHQYIVSLCGNKKIIEMYNKLNIHVPIARAYYMMQESIAEESKIQHRELVKALEARDSKALDRVIRKHIKFSKDHNLSILTRKIQK
jgi:DNA-binding GntR family transcriptional regulator